MDAHTLASSDITRHILHNRPTMGQTKKGGPRYEAMHTSQNDLWPQITMCMLVSTSTIPFACFTVKDGQKLRRVHVRKEGSRGMQKTIATLCRNMSAYSISMLPVHCIEEGV